MPEEKERQNFISIEHQEHVADAIRELRLASAHISMSASGQKPFVLSKLLNVMFKTTNDNLMILHMLVGNTDMKVDYFDESFQTPTIKLFKVFAKELEGVK